MKTHLLAFAEEGLRQCPKCLSGRVSQKYSSETLRLGKDGEVVKDEWLACKCALCGYEFEMETADAAKKKKATAVTKSDA